MDTGPGRSNALFPALLLGLVVALTGLGWRGIWDPDEGRYSNVAVEMLATGDFIHPHRHHETGHWTKPPLTYWTIAASLATFGRHPFAARLPAALAFLASIALVFAITRILLPGQEGFTAVVYATSFLPFAASQVITTDFLLAAWLTLAVYGFVRARFGEDGRARAGIALMWTGFGLAFLTKGPPALLPLAAILVFSLTSDRSRRVPVATVEGVLLFLAIALPWYLVVIADEPRLLGYFLGHEVLARVATSEHGRHGEWYGWLQIYLPTLVVGTLPWTLEALRTAYALAGGIGQRWRERLRDRRGEVLWFLIVWFTLPFVVFCIARSRLPLYLLPLFVPLAILIADHRIQRVAPLPRFGWLVAWIGLLLLINAAFARLPTHKDASAWADHLRRHVPESIGEVVFVDDMARYGLHLELGAEVEKVTIGAIDPSPINPEFDMSLAAELDEDEAGRIWITKRERFAEVAALIRHRGWTIETAAPDFEGRVIFRVVADPARRSDPG